MSIWRYSRWKRLWGSGQIRRRGGSSRCWSRMMYCCSLWDSDNTSAKVEQGKGGKNWSLLIQTGLETRHTWKWAFKEDKFVSRHWGFPVSVFFFFLMADQLPNCSFNLNVNYNQGLTYFPSATLLLIWLLCSKRKIEIVASRILF